MPRPSGFRERSMETTVARITDDEAHNREIIETAGHILKSGGLVAFPTETVYGLGADAMSPRAARKIYEAKGRPSDNPLIVHIAGVCSLERVAASVPDKAMRLAELFWPGPLTMILEKQEDVPLETTGGLNTVAVRMPRHPIALALIEAGGGFLAAPSANRSGRPSPTLAEHVARDLDGRIPLIVDGGPAGIGIESTIVDFTEGVPTILRPGYVTKEQLAAAIGEVRMDPGLAGGDARPKAPGMKYRHYAPKAELILVEGNQEAVEREISRRTKEAMAAGKVAGIIATDESLGRYPRGIVKSIGKREDEASIARHLYAVLREFDEQGADVIYSESFPARGIGQAIMNRMLKAAGHKVVRAEDVEG